MTTQVYKNIGVIQSGPYAAAQLKFSFPGIAHDLQKYLVAIEIGLDEANHVPSSQIFCDLAIGDKNDSNRTYINLKQDNLSPYGQMHWAGCLPIDDRWILIAQLFGVNTDDTWYVNYILSDLPVHNSDPGHNVVGSFPIGRTIPVSVDGAAGVETVLLQPPRFRRWEIMKAYGFHNDTSARVAQFLLSDGATSVELNSSGSLAGSSYLQLLDANMPKLIVNYDSSLQFKVTSLGVGKVGSIRAAVLEYGWDTK